MGKQVGAGTQCILTSCFLRDLLKGTQCSQRKKGALFAEKLDNTDHM